MNRKEIIDTIINEILETKLIFKDIFYKINDDESIYIYLYTKKEHIKQKSVIFYDTLDKAIAYLHGMRKTLYLLELESEI